MSELPMRVARAVLTKPLFRYLRVQVRGTQHIPRTGGVVLAANHLSYLDIFLLGLASPRPVRFVGKAELARGVLGAACRALGMVPVERGRGDRSALATVSEALGAGSAVGMFPEGTRSPDGRIYRFRSGVVRTVGAAQVPTVPVAIAGTGAVWPKGGRLRLARPPAGAVSITFLPPVPPPGDLAVDRRAFTESLESLIARETGQAAAGTFARISA